MTVDLAPDSSQFPSAPNDTEAVLATVLHFPDTEAEPESEKSGLYNPETGILVPFRQDKLPGGVVNISTYLTGRASHRVGDYIPEGYDPKAGLPVILMTTPLGTGVKGHNHDVAGEMMRAGFRVILKGVPRYNGFTIKALGLAEDANEMFGIVQAINSEAATDEKIKKLFIYGESQAAMKALAVLGLAADYGFEIEDGLIVAPCCFDEINLRKPIAQLSRLGQMAAGMIRYAKKSTPEQLNKKRGTFSFKDLHHHVIVIPVLGSGETGTFTPYLPPEQDFSVSLFAKDGHSDPYNTKAKLKAQCPKAEIEIYEDYGHVDGILSEEMSVMRGVKLYLVAKKYDSRFASLNAS